MNRFTSLSLAFVLMLSVTSFADDVRTQNSVAGFSSTAISFSGTISDDGRFLIADDATVWRIANVELVKAHEGESVRMQVQTDTTTKTIRVLRVRVVDQQVSSMTHLGDAAFRR